ncbi:hypothetical protein AB0F59_22395 [Micromonospora lupini]|uniref:hypothetical protein n=1 Tax=Micromonospora lupini TaxID=285679 RepID=UPI0033D4B68B
MNDELISAQERALIGALVDGVVEAVFRWGVIVDLGMSHVGLIDVLYVDDGDRYHVGSRISAYMDGFDEQKRKFILRPPGQVPLVDRLKRLGLS